MLSDSGSQRSYITKKLVDTLDLRGPTETLNVSTFGKLKDYYFSFVHGECIKGPEPDTLTAVNSTLGWILSGSLTGQSTSNITTMLLSVLILWKKF